MEFSRYQKQAIRTAVFRESYPGPVYPTLGLTGEAGEVAEKVKKVLRDKGGDFDAEAVAAISKELGDVLWYCAVLADELGLDLDTIAANNLEKLASRQIRGQLQGSGDER